MGSQETRAKDALLHLLLKEDMRTQKTGAVTTLARIVLRAIALTSPSSISRTVKRSAATSAVESVQSGATGTELGSTKYPALVQDNKAKSADGM